MELKDLKEQLEPRAKSLADAASELKVAAGRLNIVSSLQLPPLTASALKQGKQPFSAERARQALEEVRNRLGQVHQLLIDAETLLGINGATPTVLVPSGAGEALVSVSGGAAIPASASVDALAFASRTPAPANAEKWGFSEFLTNMGEAIVKAQRQLDAESHRYVAEQVQPGGALPAMFRIPKLTADIKFALTKEGQTGLNLLVFSDKQKSSEQHQQSMSFDIVAVPPPPELIREVQSRVPRIQVVYDPEERQRVFDVVARVKDSKIIEAVQLLGDPEEPEKHNVEKVRDHVLIIPADLEPKPPAERRYFLIHADKKEEHLVGIWAVTLDPKDPGLEPVYRFSTKPKAGENIKPFQNWIVQIGALQATILKRLRPNA